MTTSSECVTEQTQYVEPDLTRYDAIDAVINANELQERQQLDPLMQKMLNPKVFVNQETEEHSFS